MKIKFAIIPLLLVCLTIAVFLVLNTGRRAVDRLVPDYDDVSPPKTVLSFLNDPNQSVSPAIFRSVTEQGQRLLLRGTAEPDVSVSIIGNNEHRQQILTDKDGIWSAEIDVSSDEALVLSLTSFLDGTSRVNGDEQLLRIAQPAPNLDGNPKAKAAGLLQEAQPPLILLTASGGPSRVIQTPFLRLPSQGPLILGPIEYDDRGSVIFSGFATQTGRLRVFGDDELIGETRVGTNGRWYLIAGETLPLETYNIRVQLTERGGNETNITTNFKRVPPNEKPGVSPYVVYGDTAWHVRRDLSGGGAQYTAILSQNSVNRPADK